MLKREVREHLVATQSRLCALYRAKLAQLAKRLKPRSPGCFAAPVSAKKLTDVPHDPKVTGRVASAGLRAVDAGRCCLLQRTGEVAGTAHVPLR
jgi:hypothetical protein